MSEFPPVIIDSVGLCDDSVFSKPDMSGLLTHSADFAQDGTETAASHASITSLYLIRDNQVLLFMKGTPDMPRCGFSMRVVGVLEQLGVEYGAVDVLPILQPLREVTGEIADWRTFPQLYVNGQLVGGADIVEEMDE